jgi:hypothetical protein
MRVFTQMGMALMLLDVLNVVGTLLSMTQTRFADGAGQI